MIDELYDDCGALVESVDVVAGGECCALNIPAGVWHTLRSLESGTVILEVKDGVYVPIGEEDVMKVN